VLAENGETKRIVEEGKGDCAPAGMQVAARITTAAIRLA